jgi:hypothetical protein
MADAGRAGKGCHYSSIPGPESADSRLFEWLRQAQILCALRKGPWGAEALNGILNAREGRHPERIGHGTPVNHYPQ